MKAYNSSNKPKHFTKGKYKIKGSYEARYSKKRSVVYNRVWFYSLLVDTIICKRYDTCTLIKMKVRVKSKRKNR